MNYWTKRFDKLSSDELDKVALVRVMECTNGVIQHAFRDDVPYKLSVEDTRSAMHYSMSAIKNLRIPLDGRHVTFESDTEDILRDVRDLYVNGVKKGIEKDFREFMLASAASVNAVGYDRLVKARDTLRRDCDNNVIADKVDWGFEYLMQFLCEDDES